MFLELYPENDLRPNKNKGTKEIFKNYFYFLCDCLLHEPLRLKRNVLFFFFFFVFLCVWGFE